VLCAEGLAGREGGNGPSTSMRPPQQGQVLKLQSRGCRASSPLSGGMLAAMAINLRQKASFSAR